MIICISKVCGSRGGATEILTMTIVQKCHFLAISENRTNEQVCCLCELIINNEFLEYFHKSGIFSNYLSNKELTIPYFLILISNRADFAVRDPWSNYQH